MRTRASGYSSPLHAFTHRGISDIDIMSMISDPLAFARFYAQGHQVTSRTARVPYHLEWVNESSTQGSRLCGAGIVWMRGYPLHCSRWCGAGIMWMRGCPLTHGSRWCRTGIMWMRGCPLHTADRCWGAGIVWILEQCLPNTAAADEGLVSCEWVRSQVIVLCTRQNTAPEAGGCMLIQWAVRHLRRHANP